MTVTDVHHRRRAIIVEKTLPVFDAAHIKTYVAEGPHLVNNSLLLKSDFHIISSFLQIGKIHGQTGVQNEKQQ